MFSFFENPIENYTFHMKNTLKKYENFDPKGSGKPFNLVVDLVYET